MANRNGNGNENRNGNGATRSVGGPFMMTHHCLEKNFQLPQKRLGIDWRYRHWLSTNLHRPPKAGVQWLI